MKQNLLNFPKQHHLSAIVSQYSIWSKWAVELADLQNKYPEIAKTVKWSEAFKDWDGSTGAFLPLHNEWVITKAYQLTGRVLPDVSKSETPKVNKKSKNKSKKLF